MSVFFFRISLICCILIALLSPSNVCALRLWDADAVVTMRDGLPCFSYPQDEEIRKRPYSFGYLDVSKTGSIGGGMWVAQLTDPYNGKRLLEPNSPETCIRYGGPHPGVKDYYDPAKPLQMDTPYIVFIGVISRSEGLYERNFLSSFCLTRDENGSTVLVDIKQDSKTGEWKCLKTGEKPKKSFWKRLFGK
jgi:hypothetical protein